MGLVPLAQNAGMDRVAAGQVLMYGRTGAYMCMDGCAYVHGRVLIYAWKGAYIYMHGRVLIYAWTGVYICMDGCLYMHGRLLILHGRVPGRNLPGECTLPFNTRQIKWSRFVCRRVTVAY